MEIEKRRESSWRIQLKNQNEKIELTSVELSGEVRIIRMKLIKASEAITIELRKEEFFNFLSLMSAFKDVVIGEEQEIGHGGFIPDNSEITNHNIEENVEIQSSKLIRANNNLNEDKSEDLNPEEWDPW